MFYVKCINIQNVVFLSFVKINLYSKMIFLYIKRWLKYGIKGVNLDKMSVLYEVDANWNKNSKKYGLLLFMYANFV